MKVLFKIFSFSIIKKRLLPVYDRVYNNFLKNKYLRKYSFDINQIEVVKIYHVGNRELKFFLRKSSSDFNVYLQVFQYYEYLPILDLLKKNGISTNDIVNVVDAGVNIGLTSIYFSVLFPHSKIIGIEPDSANMNLAFANLKVNCIKNVELIKSGLWHKDENLKIDSSFRDGMEWSLTVKPSSEININTTIPGITIQMIMDKYLLPCIDILKIDIEGAERFIFDKSISNLDFLRRVKVIAIEIHNEYFIEEKVKNVLLEYQFSLFKKGETIFAINDNMAKVKIK